MSFAEVSKIPGIRIKIDTIIDNCFTVTYNTNVFEFLPCSDGLYYFDITSFENNSTFTNYSFLETVANNKAYFTSTEVKKAGDARALQRDIGWPSTAQFKYYISKQLINNSPITVDDINRAEYIFGPAKPLLEGKMTRVSPQECKIQRIPLPIPILQQHKQLELYVDFFFVNGHPFLTTRSSKVKILTAHMCQSRSKKVINEFASIREYLLPIQLHVYGKDEYVGVIERALRVTNERCRCACHAIPYKYYTKLMLRSLIAVVIRWINAFPSKGSVSSTMSPAMIVEGKNNPGMKNRELGLGPTLWSSSDRIIR